MTLHVPRFMIGAPILSASGLGILATIGCIELNPDHCIRRGGDFDCGGAQMCAISRGPATETNAQGCYDAVPSGLLHVPYGVPARLGTLDDQGLDSVAGVLRTAVGEDDRCFNQSALDALRGPWNAANTALVDALDHVSRKRAVIDEGTEDLILAFGEAMAATASCADGFADTDGETDTTHTTTEGDNSGGPPCEGPEDCIRDEGLFCRPDRGQCVSCEGMPDPNAACAEVDETRPVCEHGVCVPCTSAEPGICAAQLLVCNSAQQGCDPCTEHDQCSSGACDIFVGLCFDPAVVIKVGGSGGAESIGAGLVGLDALWPDALGRRRGVLVLHAGAIFVETVTIQDAGLVEAVAFVSAGGSIPRWTNTTPDFPTLTVTGLGTRAYLQGIAIRDNEGPMVGWGIQCSDARVDIRRSRIVANRGGGILALGKCELYVANSFVGGRVDDRDAIELAGADATATILYSTIGGGLSSASALRCVEGSTVDIRNSLLVALTSQPEIVCQSGNLTITTTASEAGGLGNMSHTWFSGYNGGDFRLTTQAPAGIRIADWQPGDPPTDIGGAPRYTHDDELDYAGADVYFPD